MGKKSKRNRSKASFDGIGDESVAPGKRMVAEETSENLRFQDPFVDEIEDDELGDDEIGGEEAGDGVELVQSWHPLLGMPADGPLEMDPSAYKMYHTLTPEWPSLSFDFLRDELGDARQRFPHSLQAVIGSQADESNNNQLTIMKLSDLSRLPAPEEEDMLGDEYDEEGDDGDSSSEEDVDLDPIMEHYSLPHHGGVNRVRAMPQNSDIVASWSDTGQVSLYNINHIRARFATGEPRGYPPKTVSETNQPYFTHSGHGVEGYAMDWSPAKKGTFATGDNDGRIHTWTPREEGAGFEVSASYDCLKDVSVEDLQWSPTEGTVFAAAESGGHISIYDTRAPHRYMLRNLIHEANKADVNVTSWNHIVSNLLATGGDDGTLSVWDLRQFSKPKGKSVTPLARFSCHKTPITSVEWHPTDESMLALSDEVGAYIYDLSVEADSDLADTRTLVADIPPQLLFCHSGSQDFKELHWHPQISSCIMTTAFSGFSIFIPSNL